MARRIAHYVTAEMALLGLFELALSFVLIDAMLSPVSAAALWLAGADVAALLTITIAVVAATIGLYRPEALIDRGSLFASGFVASLLAFPVGLAIVRGTRIVPGPGDTVWLLTVLAVWLAAILATRLMLGRVLNRARLARRVLVVGEGERAAKLYELLRSDRFWRFEPMPTGWDGRVFDAATLRRQRVWGVILARETNTEQTIPVRRSRGLRIFDDRTFHEIHLGRIDLDTIDADWLLGNGGARQGRTAAIIKRATDIVVSLGLLALACPLMGLTAVLIRLESAGPAFYRQQRVGLNGVHFTILKFRSMTVDAEAGGQPSWAQRQDPRVTRMGSLMRPMRIDELPQLLNVLRGEMSMIGPRPERPHFVEQLARVIPFYLHRGCVKPGLTGWAQVNFPYGASVEDAREKLAYDLYYVRNRGFLLDLLILFSTVRVVLFREGAR